MGVAVSMGERIEGVPVGTKLVRIGGGITGETAIGRYGIPFTISLTDERMSEYWPIIVPDNVYNVIDLATVPIPEGWERDGDQAEDRIVDGKKVPGYFREIDYGGDKSYIGQGKNAVFACRVYSAKEVSGDPRRIHVRKIQPKTRRVQVLIYTVEISSTRKGPGVITLEEALRAIATNSDVYKISEEERPL